MSPYIRLFALLAVLLPAFTARAEKDARSFYQSATRHYNLTEYAEALKDFKEAYRLKPDPAFLFNIAQCYRQLGDFTNASSFYRNYRREAPTAPNKREVDRLIEEMDKAAAAERARQPPIGTEPPRDPSLSGPNTPLGPTTGTPDPTATRGDLTSAPPPKDKPIHKKAWFWGVVGGGAALVVTAVVLGVVLGSPASDPRVTFGRVEGN